MTVENEAPSLCSSVLLEDLRHPEMWPVISASHYGPDRSYVWGTE